MIMIVSDQIFSMNKGNISAKGKQHRKTDWTILVVCLKSLLFCLFKAAIH